MIYKYLLTKLSHIVHSLLVIASILLYIFLNCIENIEVSLITTFIFETKINDFIIWIWNKLFKDDK